MKLSRGFTLIELLIIFAVTAVLSGMTIASYRTTTEIRNLESETRRLVDIFNLAYKKGYSAETGPLAQCADFQGYQIALTPINKSYSLTKCCNIACNGAQSTLLTTYTIPQTNIAFTAPVSGTTYRFKPLSVDTVVNPIGNTTITIRNSAITKCISLNVSSAGAVQENAKVTC